MSLTDVEVSRALNALTTTLNDRRADEVNAESLQRIVTGALGGETHLRVRGTAAAAFALTDPADHVVGRLHRENGRWTSERVGAPLAAGYVPSAG